MGQRAADRAVPVSVLQPPRQHHVQGRAQHDAQLAGAQAAAHRRMAVYEHIAQLRFPTAAASATTDPDDAS